MPYLGEFLSTQAGRPIQDKSGLTGKYDITYQLELPPASPEGAALPPDFFSSQIIYVVQDQLGLMLKSGKGSEESLVIDHVERATKN
jgi:uncharacterized protein (TIGR03435 family)